MYRRFAQRMRERATQHRRRADEVNDAEARALHLDLAEEFDARADEVEQATQEPPL